MPGFDPISAGINFAKAAIDKVFPDKTEAMRIKAEIDMAEGQGKLDELKTRLSAILAEANSQDKWTSRARPSFMYVIYIMILMSIPMGGLSAWKPLLVEAIINGMKLWLEAIPGELYALFGAGYLGYGANRSYDKKKILEAKSGGLSSMVKDLFK